MVNHPPGTDVIDRVNTLQFIDSMTGRLAWPAAALILGLVFRVPLTGLMNRVRRVRWGEREAELADAAYVQQAIEEVAKPLPESADERLEEQRTRIESLVTSAARLGYVAGVQHPDQPVPPKAVILWEGDQPIFQGLAWNSRDW